MKVFMILALCVCAASANFFNLKGNNGGSNNNGGGLFSGFNFGGSNGQSQPRIIKIINVDGGSAPIQAQHQHQPAQVYGPPAASASAQVPHEIIKVIRVNGGSASSGWQQAAPVQQQPQPRQAPTVVKIIKIIDGGYAAPQVHQPAPVYGAPAVHQPAPVYAAPAVHQPAPVYAAPAVHQPAPVYAAPAPVAPAPVAHVPAPVYAAPVVHQPAQVYGPPAPQKPTWGY